MNALTLVFVTLCVFALAYRYYGIFLASKVLKAGGGASREPHRPPRRS